ncbi:MAG: hypothetical protein ACD_76C00001G0005 [uncultured bacterium]|nr:MAG: hypothetical protein ACD_76C00001G0005 [uncultured bacterium]
MTYFVYLLLSSRDNKYYIGYTSSMNKRLKEHNAGLVTSTRSRRPFELIGYEQYETESKARWTEHQLKNSAHKRNKFINELVNRKQSLLK